MINPSTGHEEDNQTNYLSTVQLNLLLVPTLQAKKCSATSLRPLTIVMSDLTGVAQFAQQDAGLLLNALKDTSGKWKWELRERYGTSKLLGQLFTGEIASRVPPPVAMINAGRPGMCSGCGLSRDATAARLRPPIAIHFDIWDRPAAAGAHVVVDAALKKGEESHGEVIDFGRIRP